MNRKEAGSAMKFFFCRGQFLELSFARSLFEVGLHPSGLLFCSPFLIFMIFSLVWVPSLGMGGWIEWTKNRELGLCFHYFLDQKKKGEKSKWYWSTLFFWLSREKKVRLDILPAGRSSSSLTAGTTAFSPTKQTIERTREVHTRGKYGVVSRKSMGACRESVWMRSCYHVNPPHLLLLLGSTRTAGTYMVMPTLFISYHAQWKEGVDRCRRWTCVVLG